jgi:hypothetical protein
MKALLTLRQGPGAGQAYTLDARQQPLYSMGRSEGCDIVVRDRRASRHHCDVRWNGRQWEVVDRGSTNGTLVNGVAVRQSVALGPGDSITVGETTAMLGASARQPAPQMPSQPSSWASPPAVPAQREPLQPVPIAAPSGEGWGAAGGHEVAARTGASVQVAFWFVQGLVATSVACLAAGALLPWFRVTGSLSGELESLIRGISDIVSSFIGDDLLSVTQDVGALSGYGKLTLGLAVLGAIMLIADIFLRRQWIVAALVYILPSAAVSAVIASDLNSLYDLYEQVQSMSLLFGIELADVVEAFGSFMKVEVTLLPGLYLTVAGLGLIFMGGIARLIVALLARND